MGGGGGLRCSEDENEADACAPRDGHLELPDGIDREDEQEDVEGHAGAVQRHREVVVVPVVEVLLPFERVPRLVEWAADKCGQDRIDDQVDCLKHEHGLDCPFHAGSGRREDATVEEEDRRANCGCHCWVQPEGTNDALTFRSVQFKRTVVRIRNKAVEEVCSLRKADHTLNHTAYSPTVISQSGLPTPAWRFTYPAIAVQQMYMTLDNGQSLGACDAEWVTYKCWNHGPIIMAEGAGAYPQRKPRENSKAGDDTKGDARNGNGVYFVSIIHHSRWW